MIAPMKPVLALVLLCLPTQVSAAERCASQPNRSEIARVVNARPPTVRAEIGRPLKVRAPAAWRLLLEQQIL